MGQMLYHEIELNTRDSLKCLLLIYIRNLLKLVLFRECSLTKLSFYIFL